MKVIIKLVFSTLLMLSFQFSMVNAQISINSDGSSPDESAMLDVRSSNKGILIPRMDSISRNNIANPAVGLMVFDSTTNSFWYYANSNWNNVSTMLSDADGDTKIQVEEGSDDDIIRFDLGGTEFMRLDSGRIEIVNTGNSVFIGEGAGANDDYDDNENVFIGHQSGYSNTEGNSNSFIGHQSGYSNTEGNSNSFIGIESGFSNIDGNINVFIGNQSGYFNTTGNGNIFQGSRSGYSNTTGSYNIFQGYQSGYSNTTGSNNNFIGTESGFSNTDGEKNTFLGYQSGYSNTIGLSNLFQGYQSGYSNTIGLSNLFQGAESGYTNVNGSFNTFQGYQSGYANTSGGSNVFLGYRSGYANTAASFNTFQGTESGYGNTTGSQNTFLGYQSGYGNTTGHRNVSLGYESGYSSTTGQKNVFLGYRAGYYETGDDKLYIANSNTSTPLIYGDFDSDSLQINGTLSIKGLYEFPIADGTINQTLVTDGNGTLTWSDLNTSLATDLIEDVDADTKIQVEENKNDNIIRFDLGGTEFMRLDSGRIEIVNTGGSVFIGEGAGANDDYSNNQNVFIGYESGYYNTAGNDNIFQGYQSGYSNTTGEVNIFLGYQSGRSNTTGDYNIFQGFQSGYYNTTGSDNIFQGYRSGYSNTTGEYNIFQGNSSGHNNTTGNKNIFLGYQAGYNETGSNKLYIDNSSTNTPLIYGDFDSDNIQINGSFAIQDNITGTKNFIAIIENTANDNSQRCDGLQIIAGHDSYNNHNNHFINFSTFNGSTIGKIRQNANGVDYETTSDIRLKTNIQPTTYGLDDILNIQVRDYSYKSDATNTAQTGFLAQQLYKVFPNAVSVGGEDAKTEPWMVDYSKLTPLLVKGMQEQQEVIDQLTIDNGQLTINDKRQQAENQQLKQRLEELEAEVLEIEALKAEVKKINALEAKLEALLQNQQ